MNTTLLETWNIGKSEDLYGIRGWGKGYFRINELGHVAVHPSKDPSKGIDLKKLVDQIAEERGIFPPVLLRFPEILKHRLAEMAEVFATAMGEAGYTGEYRCVYPIKVNQQRHVVEEIFNFGSEYGFGLEAGSKPELLAVLALVDDDETPIICNGFKDAEYIEAVLLAQKLGRKIIPVIENFHELQLLVQQGAKHGLRPMMGIRMKLAKRGSGKWETSSGPFSKFGLTVSELLNALDYLSERGLADRLHLLHFHIGSQITNIRSIKEAISEAARLYVELKKAGAGLQYLDVGGGLGIDYDGSQTNFESSMNYTLREYANDVVYGVLQACDQSDVPHPILVSESGRAIAAYYSVLVFNVLGVSDPHGGPVPDRPTEELPTTVANLYDALADLTSKNVLETYHDALKYYDDALNLFNLGYMSLRDRALAERVFWHVCRKAYRLSRRHPQVHEDLQQLEPMLSETYFCNFSVFQSMPDSWAVDQLFPIMPVHRLQERPERRGTLADTTCDSDGRIDHFIDLKDVKHVLELHPLNGEEYLLGAFLVGAYQEILGDLHNLFGDTHAVHITLGDDGKPELDHLVEGDTVREVLRYVQYDPDALLERFRGEVGKAVQRGRISAEEGESLLNFYQAGLDGYTYLEGDL